MSESAVQGRYINLLKAAILNLHYYESSFAMDGTYGWVRHWQTRGWHPEHFSTEAFKSEAMIYDEGTIEGKYAPVWGHSMLGIKRMENVENLLRSVIDEEIPGDFVECGAWRGGTCIFARGLLEALGVKDRDVWVCDSFQGLPPVNVEKYPADEGLHLNKHEMLAVPLDQVQENFRAYDLLDDRVHFIKGYFSETLHKADVETIAILRLDGDLYESTMDTLTALFDKVSPGGYIIVDDYHAYEACEIAIHDFRKERKIDDEIIIIDHVGAYWRKPKE